MTIKVRQHFVWSLTVIFLLTLVFISPAFSQSTVQASETGLEPMVDRIAGVDSYKTAVAVSQKGWETSDYAVLAKGDNFADALCAGPLAQKYGGPILLTASNQLNADTLTELKRLGVKHLFITGGVGAISQSVEDTLQANGIATIERIAGYDRYETSVKIAQKIGNTGKVILAPGGNFPDALSISVIAAKLGMPILLTDRNALPASVRGYFQTNTVTQTYVVGGTAVISDEVAKGVPAPSRLAGIDRYATNVAILQNFASKLNFDNIYVATGINFADALSGAVLAAKSSSPLVLIDKTLPTGTANYLQTQPKLPSKVFGLGGSSVVSSAVLTAVLTGIVPAEEKIPVLAGVSESAIPLTTKLLVNGVEKTFEAYTIKGKEYFKLGDLALALQGTKKGYTAAYYSAGKFTVIDNSGSFHITSGTASILTGKMVKGDGTTKKAILTTPKVYFNSNEVRSFTVYNINGTDYYQLDELMDLLITGVIRDKNANTINLDTSKYYEPAFLPIPQGDAAYQKLQQELYAAYFNGDAYVSLEGRVTVPDNGTLYVPTGVTLGTSGADRIFLGNNSTFDVRGGWDVEYPDTKLFPVSNQTKNAIYIDHNPNESYQPGFLLYAEMRMLTPAFRVRLDGNKWAWNETDIPFEAASVSYGSSQHGVDEIILNFTRSKLDVKEDLKVVLYEKGGATHTIMYRNVRKNVDLIPELANIVGKNIGKDTTITKIDVYNYFVGPHDDPANKVVLKPISIPVNWNIVTSGDAPTVDNLAEYKGGNDIEDAISIHGLAKDTYIAKYEYSYPGGYGDESINYALISPEHKYTIRHLDFEGQEAIVGDRTNVALIKGQKGAAQNSYVFTVSPLSRDIMYTDGDCDYPSEASLTTENGKTYLNYKMANFQGLPSRNAYPNLMIRAQIKGAAGATTEVIFKDRASLGKFDITSYIPSQVEKLYIHGYWTKDVGGDLSSTKFVEISLGSNGLSAMESVKLGADTVVNISKNALSGGTGTITSNVAFKNQTSYSLSVIQISPTGKNSWTDLLRTGTGYSATDEEVSRQLKNGKSLVLPMTFNSGTLWDIKGTYSTLSDIGGVPRAFVITGLDFSGISSAPGASIELKTLLLTGKTVAIVTNNIAASAPKAGDFGTDTIDVVLAAGDNVETFNVSDFSLVIDDGKSNKYPHSDVRIIGLSQTTPGNATLTIARDLIPQVSLYKYYNQLNIYYKGYKVGPITFNHWD